MLTCWSQSLSGSFETSSRLLSQFLWFNKYIKIEGAVLHFAKFFNKGINILSQWFEDGRIISWTNLKPLWSDGTYMSCYMLRRIKSYCSFILTWKPDGTYMSLLGNSSKQLLVAKCPVFSFYFTLVFVIARAGRHSVVWRKHASK